MSRKGRDAESIVWGIHAVAGLVARSPERVLEVSIARERKDRRLKELLGSVSKAGISITEIPGATLDRMADDGAHPTGKLSFSPTEIDIQISSFTQIAG